MPLNPDSLHGCLTRLLPYVEPARVALTGGVAIGLHAAAARIPGWLARPAEDIDLVATEIGAVRELVVTEFLVSHFHLPQPGYEKFLIQLVDPAARVRLDIFPDALHALGRARIATVAGVSLHVLDAQDIMDHKLMLLSGASAEQPVEEKHYTDARLLGAICRRDVPVVPAGHRATPHFSRDIDATCPRCEASRRPGFPLAPKAAIFDVLGYV